MGEVRTRAIGRAAVRDELGAVGLRRFLESGFDTVTFDDLARAAGVSRSTFLRYFGTKEDVVLYVFDSVGERMVQALQEQPAAEDRWVALRRAVAPAVTLIEDDDTGPARLRLVWTTPALWARLHEKQDTWRSALATILVARSPDTPAPTFALRILSMAALGCVMMAYDAWVDSNGAESLTRLTDDAFAALSPRARP